MKALLEYTLIPTKKEVIDYLAGSIYKALLRKNIKIELYKRCTFLQVRAPSKALEVLRNIFGIKYIIHGSPPSATRREGEGSLPIGSSGRALSLFSGDLTLL